MDWACLGGVSMSAICVTIIALARETKTCETANGGSGSYAKQPKWTNKWRWQSVKNNVTNTFILITNTYILIINNKKKCVATGSSREDLAENKRESPLSKVYQSAHLGKQSKVADPHVSPFFHSHFGIKETLQASHFHHRVLWCAPASWLWACHLVVCLSQNGTQTTTQFLSCFWARVWMLFHTTGSPSKF